MIAAMTLLASVAVAVIVLVVLFVGMAYTLVWSLALLDYVQLRLQQHRAARSDRKAAQQ